MRNAVDAEVCEVRSMWKAIRVGQERIQGQHGRLSLTLRWGHSSSVARAARLVVGVVVAGLGLRGLGGVCTVLRLGLGSMSTMRRRVAVVRRLSLCVRSGRLRSAADLSARELGHSASAPLVTPFPQTGWRSYDAERSVLEDVEIPRQVSSTVRM